MLELRGISKRVGADTHIHPTDLTLKPGHFNILLGATLAGKTSLIQLMAGLDRPTAGRLIFNGRDVTRLAVQKRNVAVVYQQFINYPNMTVFENIASPLRVARRDRSDIRKHVEETAALLRIDQVLDRRPGELSGGQQQRTAMARALVKDSDLVLLDEPLANLDFKLREELRDELPRIFAARNCVVVYATSEPAEALLLDGMTAALHQGRVVDFGPGSQIYRRPGNLASARVFSEPPINVAPVRKTDGTVILNDTVTWPAPATLADGDYMMAIRPHHLLPWRTDDASVAVPGRVRVAELSGSESILHFDAFGRDWVSLSHGVHPFDAGAAVTLFADMRRCFYFTPAGDPVDGPVDNPAGGTAAGP